MIFIHYDDIHILNAKSIESYRRISIALDRF